MSEVLVGQSSLPRDLVVDPFAGSGSVGVVSTNLGRHFLGDDVSDNAANVTRTRLSSAGARLITSMQEMFKLDPSDALGSSDEMGQWEECLIRAIG